MDCHYSAFCVFILISLSLPFVFCQNVTTEMFSNVPVHSTEAENSSCSIHDTCQACLENKQCYFCQTDRKCHQYLKSGIIPSDCSLNEINYGSCKISLLILIILCATAGVIVLMAIIACCCCCCRKKGIKLSKDELRWARQRDERKLRAEEKKKERASRTEEIRRKYGLIKDDTPYQRFDA